MGNKYEWKDEKFKGSGHWRSLKEKEVINFHVINGHVFIDDYPDSSNVRISHSENTGSFKVEIYEPEEKPLIVKSGGTQVVLYKDKNYLLMQKQFLMIARIGSDEGMEELIKNGDLKPFSEIEKEGLTDNIALLRPMVCIAENGNTVKIKKLTYIDDDILQCVGVTYARETLSWVRLATPHELQELKWAKN